MIFWGDKTWPIIVKPPQGTSRSCRTLTTNPSTLVEMTARVGDQDHQRLDLHPPIGKVAISGIGQTRETGC